MADELNMGGLSLADGHQGGAGPRSYIPPHMRNRQSGPPINAPAPNGAAPNGPPNGPPNGATNGLNNGSWAGNNNYGARQSWNNGPDGGASQFPNNRRGGGWNSRGGGGPSGGGHDGGHSYTSRGSGDGQWRDGKHIPGPANPRIERELFGTIDDPSKQHTGINFEKYDDIPVEASGQDVPEPVTQFSSPPLDEHLCRNIELAHYKVPTPVQKYSIPIVSSGRDLMACAQTGSGKTGGFLFPILSQAFINGPSPVPANAAGQFGRQRKAYPTSLILAPSCGNDDRRVKPKGLCIYPEEPKNRLDKKFCVVVDVEFFRSNTADSVELPNSHKGSAKSKPKDKATGILSCQYLSCIFCQINPCVRCYIRFRVALQFASH